MNHRKGRPPLDPADASTKLCLTLPGKRYDALYRQASTERLSVQELIRRELTAAQLRTLRNTKSSS